MRMKETMQRIQSFLTFTTPTETDHIQAQFTATHSENQQRIQGWSENSTRQKLIANYWCSDVLIHYTALISFSVLISWLMVGHFDSGTFLMLLIVALFSFSVLLVTHYWPRFRSEFLPKLEAIISVYKNEQHRREIGQLQQELAASQEQARKEQERITLQFQEQIAGQQRQTEELQQQFQVQLNEKLAEQQTRLLWQQEAVQDRFQEKLAGQRVQMQQQQEEIKKCRQAQLSNFALTLIYYVFVKAAANHSIESDDHTANLLLKLYGVDRGSLRTNLELIAGSSSKRKNLGERKYTEIRNRFEEAINFFTEMDFPRGVLLLKELESKFVHAQKNEFDKV